MAFYDLILTISRNQPILVILLEDGSHCHVTGPPHQREREREFFISAKNQNLQVN